MPMRHERSVARPRRRRALVIAPLIAVILAVFAVMSPVASAGEVAPADPPRADGTPVPTGGRPECPPPPHEYPDPSHEKDTAATTEPAAATATDPAAANGRAPIAQTG